MLQKEATFFIYYKKNKLSFDLFGLRLTASILMVERTFFFFFLNKSRCVWSGDLGALEIAVS